MSERGFLTETKFAGAVMATTTILHTIGLYGINQYYPGGLIGGDTLQKLGIIFILGGASAMLAFESARRVTGSQSGAYTMWQAMLPAVAGVGMAYIATQIPLEMIFLAPIQGLVVGSAAYSSIY